MDNLFDIKIEEISKTELMEINGGLFPRLDGYIPRMATELAQGFVTYWSGFVVGMVSAWME